MNSTFPNIIFSQIEDYNNVHNILISTLDIFPKRLMKKIIICSTEIIQNNILHNTNHKLSLSIHENDSLIITMFDFFVNNDIYNSIKAKIDTINSLSIQKLQTIYKYNLQNTNQISTGANNGLVLCRLKSNNYIELQIKDNNLTQSSLIQVQLILKFDKNGNNHSL